MTIARTTIKNVQLVKVGTWGGMTGKSTITEQHLTGAVAAYADPEVDRAALKIGHDGDLNLGTGHPALGWIENLKLSADKKTLIGDLADIPTKLASIIPKAYRRRSVEMNLGVTTPSGKNYAASLTGLALLGAKAPAVKGLDDILEFYASEADSAGDDTTAESAITFAVDDDADTPAVPHAPGAGGESGDGSTNPEERSADMALSDALKKKLGLPETATEAEVEAALEAATIEAPADPAAAAPAGTPETPAAPAAGAPAPAADATAGAGAPASPAAGAQLAEGVETVVLTKAVFAELQGGNESLKVLLAERAAEKKEKALDAAIRAGKIAPAERVAFAAAWDKNAESTETLLSTLTPRFTTVELGEIGDDRAADAGDDTALHAQADALGL